MTTSSAAGAEIELGGRRLAIRHLDRVVFPAAGTTKAELLEYYVRVGDVMLAHLRDRLLHMHRYPAASPRRSKRRGLSASSRRWRSACAPARS